MDNAVIKNVATAITSLEITDEKNSTSIEYWINLYFKLIVSGSPEKTINAKKNDISKFLLFFKNAFEHSNVEFWTPSVTKHFQKLLLSQKNNYKATTVNRIMATIRHFAKWLYKQKSLPAGNPTHGIKDIVTDEPDWNGLTDMQLMKLKAACDHRLKICNKKHQNPLMEVAIFFTLLHTGLREFELVSLNIDDYYARGFHFIKRKGNKVSKKIPVPADARQYLDLHIEKRKSDIIEKGEDVVIADEGAKEPLFVSRYGNRLSTHDVIRICNRISDQACAYLPADKKFKLNPHMLRHTFLKRVADKHGIHVAQKISGNISISEIFRYTKPSQDEIDNSVEELFL